MSSQDRIGNTLTFSEKHTVLSVHENTPYSFQELCNIDGCSGICIPIIQREYAQGRRDCEGEEIRKNFIPELIDSLWNGKSKILNFVFGAVDNGWFLPLDGQQRLTTLLLFYWYFDGNINYSQKFKYLSRRISDTFIKQLFMHRPLYCNSRQMPPSSWVKNPTGGTKCKNWFYDSWANDPTVDGMLMMLDEIHCQFWNLASKINDKEDILEKLRQCRENLNYLKFYLKIIDGVDADLAYTKMNARGMPLTNWENLKALIDGKLECGKYDQDLISHWRYKVDNDWLVSVERIVGEKHCNDKLSNDEMLEQVIGGVNRVFERVFNLAMLVRLSVWKAASQDFQKSLLAVCDDLINGTAALSVYEHFMDERTIRIAELFLDCISDQQFFLHELCGNWEVDRSQNLLWSSDNSGSRKKAEDKIDCDGFVDYLTSKKQWSLLKCLRFILLTSLRKCEWFAPRIDDARTKVRAALNILDNSNSLTISKFAAAVKEIVRLLRTSNIEQTLKFILQTGAVLSKDQIQEEMLKAQKRNDEGQKEIIFSMEKDSLLNGSIGFLYNASENIFSKEWYGNFKRYCIVEDTNKVRKFSSVFFEDELLSYFPDDVKEWESEWIPIARNDDDWRRALKHSYIRKILRLFFEAVLNDGCTAGRQTMPRWAENYRSLLCSGEMPAYKNSAFPYLCVKEGIAYATYASGWWPAAVRLTYSTNEVKNLSMTELRVLTKYDIFSRKYLKTKQCMRVADKDFDLYIKIEDIGKLEPELYVKKDDEEFELVNEAERKS